MGSIATRTTSRGDSQQVVDHTIFPTIYKRLFDVYIPPIVPGEEEGGGGGQSSSPTCEGRIRKSSSERVWWEDLLDKKQSNRKWRPRLHRRLFRILLLRLARCRIQRTQHRFQMRPILRLEFRLGLLRRSYLRAYMLEQ